MYLWESASNQKQLTRRYFQKMVNKNKHMKMVCTHCLIIGVYPLCRCPIIFQAPKLETRHLFWNYIVTLKWYVQLSRKPNNFKFKDNQWQKSLAILFCQRYFVTDCLFFWKKGTSLMTIIFDWNLVLTCQLQRGGPTYGSKQKLAAPRPLAPLYWGPWLYPSPDKNISIKRRTQDSFRCRTTCQMSMIGLINHPLVWMAW